MLFQDQAGIINSSIAMLRLVWYVVADAHTVLPNHVECSHFHIHFSSMLLLLLTVLGRFLDSRYETKIDYKTGRGTSY
jgi:hypothetical protein